MRIGGAIVLGVLAAAGCERLLALDPVHRADANAAPDGSNANPCAAPFAHYAFEDSSALTDSSGNHYDGQIDTPGPVLEPGHLNDAYAFDGSDNVVELDDRVYQVTPLTMSMWFEPEPGSPDDVQCFINQLGVDDEGNYDDVWQVCIDVGTVAVYGRGGMYENGAATTDSWHHVVLELDGSNGLLWLDGSGSAFPFPLDYTNAAQITIGADHDAMFKAHYAGGIDELALFHCAVPADQLLGL